MSEPTEKEVQTYLSNVHDWFDDSGPRETARTLGKCARKVIELDRENYELRTALTLATQRAEAAEAERDAYEMAHVFQAHAIASLEAERDALRKVDDAMVGRFLRAYAECEGERPQTFTHRIGVRAALDAALAVQP